MKCAVCEAPIIEGHLCDDCDIPEPCPMGCGRTTDDVAGGPCTDCWDLAGQTTSPYGY